jgi:hypothetical protein
MPRQARSRQTELDLQGTVVLRWNELPADVRAELRDLLHVLLVHADRTVAQPEAGRDE